MSVASKGLKVWWASRSYMEITDGRSRKCQGGVVGRSLEEWSFMWLFKGRTRQTAGMRCCRSSALWERGHAEARFISSTEWCQAELSDRELTEAEEPCSPAGCMWACTMPGSLCQSPPRHRLGDVMPAVCDLSADKGWSLCWAAGVKSWKETSREICLTDKNGWPHFEHISFARFHSPEFLLWSTSSFCRDNIQKKVRSNRCFQFNLLLQTPIERRPGGTRIHQIKYIF